MPDRRRLGFIGCGVMGEGIARSLIAAGVLSADDIIASDADPARLALVRDQLGIATSPSNEEVARGAGTVVLAVKPQVLPGVLEQVGRCLAADQLLVSIAAGIKTGLIRKSIGGDVPLIRVMPNVCCLVGEGAFGYCCDGPVPDAIREEFAGLLGAIGQVVQVEEKLMDAVTAVSGSGPAYVFKFIEAMADGGVAAGLPRASAQRLAAQTVLGAAKMVLEMGRHPAELKDRVCSPGGTTIAGVRALERGRFGSAVIEAVIAADQRSRELGG